MKIEVLYIDGCPHFPATVDAVKKSLGPVRPHLSSYRNDGAGSRDGDEDRLSRIAHRPHRRFGYRAASTPENRIWDDVPYV